MHKVTLRKPDGRFLHLYSQTPIANTLEAPSPQKEPFAANPHLRWHPLRGEWVIYAAHREQRTFLPPPEFNPLLPQDRSHFPTELPAGDYEIAVFDNLFPSLTPYASNPPSLFVPTLSGIGACEVVVFTQEPTLSLAVLSIKQIQLLIDVWAERYETLGARREIAYVMAFENRGVEMGVTLHHPHGQIYAYPFIPPVQLRHLHENKKYFCRTGRSLLEDFVAAELENETRILYSGSEIAAFVPICARYPYEVWIAPGRRVRSLVELSGQGRLELARALKTVLLKFDRLWNRPFPYLLVIHQAPTNGEGWDEAHFFIEVTPLYRAQNKLKFLAGTELGAGVFANDSLPEEKAAELRAVEVAIE